MKKTISLNVAGRLFNIEEDACVMLENYLAKIENGYASSTEGKEISSDMETRIAELLESNPGKNNVITVVDIDRVISILGKPEDLGASRNASYKETYSTNYQPTLSKRIYRDPDNRRLGGVCGGLGVYFDIDPVLLRILFFVLLFVGFGFLLYLIMWIAIPKAKNTAQKLAMHGLPPTPENVRRFSSL